MLSAKKIMARRDPAICAPAGGRSWGVSRKKIKPAIKCQKLLDGLLIDLAPVGDPEDEHLFPQNSEDDPVIPDAAFTQARERPFKDRVGGGLFRELFFDLI